MLAQVCKHMRAAEHKLGLLDLHAETAAITQKRKSGRPKRRTKALQRDKGAGTVYLFYEDCAPNTQSAQFKPR